MGKGQGETEKEEEKEEEEEEKDRGRVRVITVCLKHQLSHGQRSLAAYSPWGCKSLTRLSN